LVILDDRDYKPDSNVENLKVPNLFESLQTRFNPVCSELIAAPNTFFEIPVFQIIFEKAGEIPVPLIFELKRPSRSLFLLYPYSRLDPIHKHLFLLLSKILKKTILKQNGYTNLF